MRRQRREFRVTDVAVQSGLSRATVDRVLHGRPGVRPETVRMVERAIEELERQRQQVQLSGRPFVVDLVMQAPERFSSESRRALEAELHALRPALVRARSHLQEQPEPGAAARILDAVARRGSDGVILKAPDHPEVTAAVARLADAGVPTVTFVTDLPGSRRVAYAGADNRAAGATAAYLIARWGGGGVLLTLSHSTFQGETEREAGFRHTMAELAPDRAVHAVTDTDGLDESLLGTVGEALRRHPDVDAVYSIGGGNRATLAAFEEQGRSPAVFVAHDLDADNRRLLRTRRIAAVLHHDLRADCRRACRLLLQAGGVLPGSALTVPSQVQVVTPFNEPAALGDG
ncbi:MAG: LacI family DNA-binding transcriptional regulator [Nocardioidaceae bacterium]